MLVRRVAATIAVTCGGAHESCGLVVASAGSANAVACASLVVDGAAIAIGIAAVVTSIARGSGGDIAGTVAAVVTSIARGNIAGTAISMVSCGVAAGASILEVVAGAIAAGTSSSAMIFMVSGTDGAAVLSSESSSPVARTTCGVESGVEVEASVASAIAPEDVRTIVEEASGGIVAIDREVPGASQPGDGVQEVVCRGEEGPLPIQQDVAEVCVAVGEVVAVQKIALRR